ncbi:MFS transporter [Wolbachia pipientis]|uniref:MFS transporter n=1 Tax=Wolbachia pipientis TaxID=955 RepID=UPI0011D11EBF|nr:MFS transporter [Wolbachia pipientis]
MLVLEIPTGILADKYSKKHALTGNCLIRSISYFVIANTETYGVFLLAYCCLGAGQAFQSGTLNAWLAAYSHDDKVEVERQFIINSNFGYKGYLYLLSYLAHLLCCFIVFTIALLLYLLHAIGAVARDPTVNALLQYYC